MNLAATIASEGFAFLPAYAPRVPTEGIVGEIGVPYSLREGNAVHQLKPRSEAAPNSYSGMFGLNQFPMHTDMAHWRKPPRYLLLRCVVGYPSVLTPVIDGATLVASVGRETLSRALVRPRRPQNGNFPLFPLLRQKREGELLLRWDENFIQPASREGVIGMECLRSAIQFAKPKAVALVQQGDTLLVDNWRMLHGRSPVDPSTINRKIDRVYLRSLH